MFSFVPNRRSTFAILLIAFLVLIGPISVQGKTLINDQEQTGQQLQSANQGIEENFQSQVYFLTGPNEGEPLDIALAYIQSQLAEWNLTQNDVADQIIRDNFVSSHNDTTHIYFRQRLSGIEVYLGDIGIHVAGDGSIITAQMNYVSDLAAKINTGVPELTAVEAIEAAAQTLELEITDALVSLNESVGPDQSATFSGGGISQKNIPVRLTYQPLENGQVRLAWEITIHTLDSLHYWYLRIDAVNGEMLSIDDWVSPGFFGPLEQHASSTKAVANEVDYGVEMGYSSQPAVGGPQYRVYPVPVESPSHTSPSPPGDGRTLETNPADPTASPYGWHDTNGAAGAEYTYTRGNNVLAQEDQNGNNGNGYRPDGGSGLNFDFGLDLSQEPLNYEDAAITNLFFWNNIMHDVWYQYGFDEASGNFQANNYGNGGTAGDYVFADAQDGAALNNANFTSPTDGGNGIMQMYLWNVDPNNPLRDGDLDNNIIAHEYGHGISSRLTGGPGTNCLNNVEQMGEGWSDWFALMMTIEPGDQGTDLRGIGSYVFGQSPEGPGIRPYLYSTDMSINPHTYNSIMSEGPPHGTGSVWTAMIWDMSWALIERYGFDPDLYSGTGGNNIAMQLVIDGLKLQGCLPGFVSGRNGILLADQNNYGGANQCLIWEVFARRGLGNSASQGNTNDLSDGTEAFNLPSQCQLLNPDPVPTRQSICTGAAAAYTVNLGSGFTSPPVTMSASGHPAGTTATFSLNPVGSVPNTSLLTINNTTGATPGSYQITVTGDDGSRSENEYVYLDLYDIVPTAPTLLLPTGGDVGLNHSPVVFSWSAVPQAETYKIDIATDPQFSNVVESAVGLTETTYESGLAPKTTLFWRVRAANPCGTTPNINAEMSAFQTLDATCTDYPAGETGAVPDAQCNFLCQIGINPLIPGVSTFDMNGVGGGTLIDLDVIGLSGNHTNVSDFDFELESPGGTQVTVLARACGSSDDYNLALDDEGDAFSCPMTNGDTVRANEAVFYPSPALSQFDGEDSAGTWQLTVTDNYPANSGDLDSWGLRACYQQVLTADYSDLAYVYDVAYHEGDGTLRLGGGWSADNSFNQDNDDATDDGIDRTGAIWTAGNNVGIEATVSGGDGNDYLACWFDWDDSGLFEPGEKTVAQVVSNGVNNIPFVVPGAFNPATNQVLDTRCRLYEAEPSLLMGTETPQGGVVGGEVEDYRFTFTPTAITLQSSTARERTIGLPGFMLALLLLMTLALLFRKYFLRKGIDHSK